MKKILFFFILCVTSGFICTKPVDQKTPQSVPSQSSQITGVLHYDNFPDGWGLYYVNDSAAEPLIFKNTFSDANAQYEYFKQYVNLHSILTFNDKGETGCLYGIGPVCGKRVVEVVSLKSK